MRVASLWGTRFPAWAIVPMGIGIVWSLCHRLDHTAAATSSTPTPALSHAVLIDDLDAPWDLAFTPDGAMLFTEKCRGLSVRRADGSIQHLFGTAGAAVRAEDFFCRGQSGAHGIAIDPDFATNRMIYLYMPSTLIAPPTNRVVRLVVDARYATVGERTDIVTDIPYKHAANGAGGAGMHSGGRLRFGPDGFLYVTTGDNHQPGLPQDRRSLAGKVLRVDRDGQAARDNTAPSPGDPRVYTYGHRNVQGIAFRPGTGDVFIAEHGPNHSDEVTRLTAGGNAGWDPRNRPDLRCPDGYCGYAGDRRSMPMTDTARFPDAMAPIWTTGDTSEGLGPNTFLTGPQWLAWNGQLAIGLLAGKRITVLHLDAPNGATESATMDLPRNRIRSLVQGPDGLLYVAVDEGAIWRVEPRAP